MVVIAKSTECNRAEEHIDHRFEVIIMHARKHHARGLIARVINTALWKNGFIYVEKLSKRCCNNFRLLYK